MNYLSSQFTPDLIVCLVFLFRLLEINSIPVFFESVVLLRLAKVNICILDFFKIRSLVESLEETLNLREHYSAIIDVFRLVILFLFISHLFACTFHYLASFEIESGCTKTWIHESGLIDKAWYSRYVASMYWS
jgi:hypothetical protein